MLREGNRVGRSIKEKRIPRNVTNVSRKCRLWVRVLRVRESGTAHLNARMSYVTGVGIEGM